MKSQMHTIKQTGIQTWIPHVPTRESNVLRNLHRQSRLYIPFYLYCQSVVLLLGTQKAIYKHPDVYHLLHPLKMAAVMISPVSLCLFVTAE